MTPEGATHYRETPLGVIQYFKHVKPKRRHTVYRLGCPYWMMYNGDQNRWFKWRESVKPPGLKRIGE